MIAFLAFIAGQVSGILLYRIAHYHGKSGELTYPGERKVRMFSAADGK